jgi:hypothetical protein
MKYLRMAWHAPGTVWDLYRIFREDRPRWMSLRHAVLCEFYAWRSVWEKQ